MNVFVPCCFECGRFGIANGTKAHTNRQAFWYIMHCNRNHQQHDSFPLRQSVCLIDGFLAGTVGRLAFTVIHARFFASSRRDRPVAMLLIQTIGKTIDANRCRVLTYCEIDGKRTKLFFF